MLAEFLSGSGFEVEQATDGRDALNKLTTNVPDVLVTDMMMPVMDGLALCREIKEDVRLAHLPVIMVTGCPLPRAREDAARVGCGTVISKPCDPDVLLRKIRTTIARTRALSEANRDLQATAARLCRETQDAAERLSQTLKRVSRRTKPSED